MSPTFSIHHPPILHPKSLSFKPQNPKFSKTEKPFTLKSMAKSQEQPMEPTPLGPRWENLLSAAASLYPLYVTAGGAVACIKPSAFSWFVERGPFAYSCALGFIMLVMGLTLELKDLFGIFRQRPLSRVIFGCAAQYIIMPALGAIISKAFGLSPSLSVGLILLACCPGGTASNVVTLIAQGDVPLSIVMTVCTTLGAVFLTPLLTKFLVGAIVPVDAVKLSMRTLQVVVAPILLGSYMQSTFPSAVKVITRFAPLLVVLTSSLLASSVFSENVVRLRSSIVNSYNGSELGSSWGSGGVFSGDLQSAILSVLLLHFAGFFVGYLAAYFCGFRERQRRAISIEVGMQNSSLGVVLATAHFSSSLVALPPALSAVIMNIIGSTLGFIWRYVDPSDTKNALESNLD